MAGWNISGPMLRKWRPIMVHNADNYHMLLIDGCGMTQELKLKWGEENE